MNFMSSRLKQARIDSGKTLEEVSYDLKIRKQYLIALEEDTPSVLPGKVYAKGYLKLYEDYLGVYTESNTALKDNTNHTKILALNKKMIDHKYKKYVVICSILMLMVISIIYHLIP